MTHYFKVFLLACCLGISITGSAYGASSSSGASNGSEPAYQLNPGDVVRVLVWREEGLQQEVRVLPDGSITFPLVGRVEVGGLSTADVAQQIATKLKEFIPDPNVTVVIAGIDGNRAYVLGKVAKPGPVIMAGPTTVLQALSMAGGLDKFADEGSIKLVRPTKGGEDVLAVDYKSLISGSDMSTNLRLKPGDTLVVP